MVTCRSIQSPFTIHHSRFTDMTDPFDLFHDWMRAASNHPGIAEPTAFTLATANAEGQPGARILLLKDFDHRGFVFYTNTQSRKGQELVENPKVALCFYWMPLKRQVRIEGTVTHVTDAQADAYFATREHGKQIGAWASEQSRPLTGRQELIDRIMKYETQFQGVAVPRPPHWSGYLVTPHALEFWQEGEFRLHERERFQRIGEEWQKQSLYP
jgi:pyridoxamine 5'-phosphate oxidase